MTVQALAQAGRRSQAHDGKGDDRFHGKGPLYRFELRFVARAIRPRRSATDRRASVRQYIGLEVNHQTRAEDAVVAGSESVDRTALVDVTVQVVELHSGIRVPVPVQSEGHTLADPAGDIFIRQVGVGVSQRQLATHPTRRHSSRHRC